MKSTMRAIALMTSVAFKADPLAALLLCISVPAAYLGPTFGALAARALVDAGAGGNVNGAIAAGALATVAIISIVGAFILNVYLVHALGKKIDALVEKRVAHQLANLPGIEHYDRADYQDQVKLLRDQSDYLGSGLNALIRLLAQILQIGAVSYLLATQSPWLLLLPLLSLPALLASGVSTSILRRAQESTAQHDRLLHRIVGTTTELPAARETRLFAIGPYLRDHRRAISSKIDSIRGRALKRSLAVRFAADLVFSIGYVAAVALVIVRALNGDLTPGDVALTIILGAQTQGFIAGLVSGVTFIAAVHIVARRLVWLDGYVAEQSVKGIQEPAPSKVHDGIRFERVSFRYPTSSRWAINDLTLMLPAGKVVAVVGENGAGKSTLVKLLLRLYEPTEGTITVDNTPLAQLDAKDWREHTTGAFQDYSRLEFLAGESIGLGNLHRLGDSDMIWAAAKGVGADAFLETWPRGLDTQLGSSWPDGVDLSGGQWQRLALARARTRSRPLLVVMDEPTSAIDAHTEHAVFQEVAAAARRAGRAGGVTVLVTHRFSTVRMADLIIVLDNGKLIEQGSHEELLASNGLYSELFTLQAQPYIT